jgi:uncharacterized protein YcbK (DUF882 family)
VINEYFKYKEFDCKCGKCERPDGVPSQELIDILTKIRKHYNQPVIINSGYRCEEHNKKVGGSANSQHFKGSAVDIIVKNTPTESVWEYVLEKWGNEPLGLAIKRNKSNIYAGFVHIDTRGKKARWEYA